jgi:tRNA threonylcarbamoyladenosine biosynthesis protein TsaB
VALSQDGQVLHYRENREGRSHAAVLAPFIQDVLQEGGLQADELDAVVVSKGPGSYTGLRIGVSTAKGICYGANLPLVAINTLQLMAQGTIQKLKKEMDISNAWLCPMIDARRMEVYTAFFDANTLQVRETAAEIISPGSFSDILKKRKVFFFGDGANKCREMIASPNAVFLENIYPSAKSMLTLALEKYQQHDFEDIAYFEPFYLKDFVATKPKKDIFR